MTARAEFSTTDPDEALARLTELYNARSILPTLGSRFGLSMARTVVADITLLRARWTGSFTLEADPFSRFLISATATGAYHITCSSASGEQVIAPGALNLITDTETPLTLRVRKRALACAIDVRPEVLHRHAERLLDTDLRGAWRPRTPTLSGGPASSLARLIIATADDANGPSPLAAHPLLQPLLAESLLTALLLATDHPWRERLDRPVGVPRPRAIQAATDALRADPARPWSTSELADEVRLSPRALQQGFRTHCGTTPTAYLRRVRLARAHQDLQAADPDLCTVELVARRWGFQHTARFATYYREQFGTLPHTTLRTRRAHGTPEPAEPVSGRPAYGCDS
ncbi:helix-turn-helix transcriptional regulator [Kitasatospora sp. NPDC127059]|uniref:helix-turn-helix transcriptional regulator n=1 Tax=unclassified Kitasatospora TaxID=2633591 RepID=UPI00365E464B